MPFATFGAGCFWGVEASFRKIPGVTATAVGYEGGHLETPTYEAVCTDETGHAEVVQVTFDPAVVSYTKLVETFFRIHDPTTRDRQGPDVGSQYRSSIFVHSQEQRAQAEAALVAAQARFKRPIVTQVVPASTFWPAEDYHQRYLEKRGIDHCHLPHQE